MKAFYKLGVGQYTFRNIPEPAILTPEDVKIKVRYCTICADETKDLGGGGLFLQRADHGA